MKTPEQKQGTWGKPLVRGTDLPRDIVLSINKFRYQTDVDWTILKADGDMWIIYKTWDYNNSDEPVFEIGAAKIEYTSSCTYKETGEYNET